MQCYACMLFSSLYSSLAVYFTNFSERCPCEFHQFCPRVTARNFLQYFSLLQIQSWIFITIASYWSKKQNTFHSILHLGLLRFIGLCKHSEQKHSDNVHINLWTCFVDGIDAVCPQTMAQRSLSQSTVKTFVSSRVLQCKECSALILLIFYPFASLALVQGQVQSYVSTVGEHCRSAWQLWTLYSASYHVSEWWHLRPLFNVDF